MLRLLAKVRASCSTNSSLWTKECRALHSLDRRQRLEMFRNEQRRQAMVYGQKVEKVFWTIAQENGENVKVLMNKNISNYRDCIKHISRLKADCAALAYSNGVYRSMLELLSGSGTVTPLGYNSRDERHADAVNKAYWRTCAFLAGAVVEDSFSTNVQLIGPSEAGYESGKFEYIARIENLRDWIPNSDELFALMQKAVGEYLTQSITVEPLLVSLEFALDMFESNVRKQELIHKLKRKGENDGQGVIVYCMGDFVDISDGPLIPNTNQIGKFALTMVEHDGFEYRFSGVSVPKELKCSSFSWDMICNASVISSAEQRRLLQASA